MDCHTTATHPYGALAVAYCSPGTYGASHPETYIQSVEIRVISVGRIYTGWQGSVGASAADLL